MAEEPEANLGKQTARGLSWNLLGLVVTNVLRLITIPVLGRLLAPSEFGLVAAAMTVIAFAMFLKDAGVGTAIVQRKVLSDQHVEAAFSFSVLFGLVLATVLVVAAPLVANFYDLPHLTSMVQVLSLMFVMRGVFTVPMAVARRRMRFRALALIDLGAFTIGSATAIACAASGVGPWSLVVGYLVESALATIFLVVLQPMRYRIVPAREPLRDLVAYGTGHTLGEIAGYFAYQGDHIVVGNQLGVHLLGLYTRAIDLMRYPSVAFSNVAGAVLFSAFSKIQDDRERLGRVYRRSIFGTSVFVLPTSAALAILAPELVRLLLGERWTGMVLAFQILAISMLPRTTFKIGATIARAAGDVFSVAAATAFYGATVVGGSLYAVQWGIEGVAAATAIAVYFNFFLLSYLGLRRTNLSWGGFFAAHVEPLFVTALVAGAVYPSALWLRAEALPGPVVILISSVAGLAAALLALIAGVIRRQPDWLWLYGGACSRLRFLPRIAP
ncbi:MAG: lipopolysaccharide biosynthesis protein [Myxococcota bacterium]|nr:lipopolysaccharide biosynthesis protein [Myxococcota bacterium]